MVKYEPWGRYPKAEQRAISIVDRYAMLDNDSTWLPFGNGRSYGDSCLNSDGTLVHTQYLNKYLAFDSSTGILRCESGIKFCEIIDTVLPMGWFLPVTPGTKFVTVGGAIANDVHGKNHHVDGCFGHFVVQFELLRSDGTRLICSPTENEALFKATIGGLGLTGLIVWADIQLKPVKSAYLDVETVPYASLDEFRQLSEASKENFVYTVAWVDCLARGENLGRGIFLRANHAEHQGPPQRVKKKLTVPIDFPGRSLNKYTIKAFNHLYYWNGARNAGLSKQHYDPYFYPLDGINNWNRIYGGAGFLQYQFVVPSDNYDAIREIMACIASAGAGSFLAVLKEFGEIPSLGMLSFPRKGVCLALDFPNHGKQTFELLDHLDEYVMAAGGAIYPAKDARMSRQAFQQFFPALDNFRAHVDPAFCSDFWLRVA